MKQKLELIVELVSPSQCIHIAIAVMLAFQVFIYFGSLLSKHMYMIIYEINMEKKNR